MQKYIIAGVAFIFSIVTIAVAQPPSAKIVAIKCGRLIDGKSNSAQQNVTILINGNIITAVGTSIQVPRNTEVIDFKSRDGTSGLIDCHTHVLLQGDITSQDYDNQLLKESIPYRTIRGAVAAQAALRTVSRQFAISRPKERCTPMLILRRQSITVSFRAPACLFPLVRSMLPGAYPLERIRMGTPDAERRPGCRRR